MPAILRLLCTPLVFACLGAQEPATGTPSAAVCLGEVVPDLAAALAAVPPQTVGLLWFVPGPLAAAQASARADASAFAALRAAHPNGNVVCVVVADAPCAELAALADRPLRLDPDHTLATDLGMAVGPTGLGDPAGPDLAVVDAHGRLWFRGDFGSGVADAIRNLASGRFAAELAQQHERLHQSFDNLLDEPPEATSAALEQVLDAYPSDGVLWSALVLIREAHGDGDADRTLDRALAVLATHATGLHTAADILMRSSVRPQRMAEKFAVALRRAVKRHPDDPRLQLAGLRAALLRPESSDAMVLAARVRPLLGDHLDLLLDYISVLTGTDAAPQFRDLAEQALQHASQFGADPARLTAARCAVALRCAGDPARAAEEFAAFAETLGPETPENDLCWRLLTSPRHVGRHDPFAALLAERMLRHGDALSAPEYDTAALAMFRIGRVQRAVELQELALQKGGRGDADYERRLLRYRAAAIGSGPGR